MSESFNPELYFKTGFFGGLFCLLWANMNIQISLSESEAHTHKHAGDILRTARGFVDAQSGASGIGFAARVLTFTVITCRELYRI